MPKTSVFYTKPAYGHMGNMEMKIVHGSLV